MPENKGANWYVYIVFFSEGKRRIILFFVPNPSSFPRETVELIAIKYH